MVFSSRISRSYKLKSGSNGLNTSSIGVVQDSNDMEPKKAKKCRLGKMSASCDELDCGSAARAVMHSGRSTPEDQENLREEEKPMKLGFIRRVFRRKHKYLKKSKSQEELPRTALNIGIEDTSKRNVRLRSKTAPEKVWQESEDKNERRMAVCEEDEQCREGFSKIVETFIVKRNMDDYGFL